MDRIGKLGVVLAVSLIALPFGCSSILGIDNDYAAGEGGAGGVGSASSATAQASGPSGSGSGSGSGAGAGSGSGGGGGGGAGAGGGGVVYEWQATEPGPMGSPCTKNFTYTLPSWLRFESPTQSERTSQVAPDALCRGYTAYSPRARNVGKGWGLSVESERTNLVRNSDKWAVDVGWGQGNMSASTGYPDPAGGVAATEFTSPASVGGFYSNYTYDNPPISGQVASSWLRGSAGVPPYAHFRHVIEYGWIDVELDQWRRYAIIQTSNKMGDMSLETRDKPAGAGVIMSETKIRAFGAQIEPSAKYPSSYIPTGSMPVTRLAESLSSEAPGELVKGGWLDVEITIAPHYASDQKSERHDVLYFDDKTSLSIATDDKIEFRINNELMETKAISFDAEDEVVIIARNTPVGRSLIIKVNGQEVDARMDAKLAAIPIPARMYILGGPAGAQECADLRSIKFTQVP